jgi:hypothetical protein
MMMYLGSGPFPGQVSRNLELSLGRHELRIKDAGPAPHPISLDDKPKNAG